MYTPFLSLAPSKAKKQKQNNKTDKTQAKL